MVNVIMNSKQFSNFISANRIGQLDSAVLFALQQVSNGKKNTQPLNKLLNLEMLRLVNGDLNKLGQEVKSYVSSFKLSTIQWQGDNSRFQYIDAEPTELDLSTVILFSEFRKQSADGKPKGGNADKPVSAKSLINSFGKLAANGLNGKPEEMALLLEGLEQAKADILKAIAAAKQEQIDADRVLELAVLQPTAKERAANVKQAV